MENLQVGDLVQWATQAIRLAGDKAAALDGRTAFFVGIAVWFGVERAIARMAGILRMAIIGAVLAAAGVGITSLIGDPTLNSPDQSGLTHTGNAQPPVVFEPASERLRP